MFEFKLLQPGEAGMATPGKWVRAVGLPLGAREWTGTYKGNEIRVTTRGPLRTRLIVNGRCLDSRSPLLSAADMPLLSAQMPPQRTGVEIVQVFSRSLLATTIEVRVAGESIAMKLPHSA